MDYPWSRPIETMDFIVGDVVVHHSNDPEWEKAVIKASGNRCQNVDNGWWCGEGKDLKAKSFKARPKSPDDGVALCPKHFGQAEG